MEKYYKVDYGDTFGILSYDGLKRLYMEIIDKEEYADFDGWMCDMERCGLVTNSIGELFD